MVNIQILCLNLFSKTAKCPIKQKIHKWMVGPLITMPHVLMS